MNSLRLHVWGLALFILGVCQSFATAADREIDFNIDIRPILSNNCFQCHGPDEAERKGGTDGLALDSLKGALVDLGGYQAIVPGHPEKSELMRRIESTDPDLAMPPRGIGKKVSAEEVELLRKWIQQGAHYAQHWSYVQPVRPSIPSVKQADWPRNEIDAFILSRLEQEGRSPNVEADRETLARRVALDLTGIPPTPEEMRVFLADGEAGAYERFVDRLLQKAAFGEHWARMWLDLARYADSAGYADDPDRTIWLYRDYVIRSFNENKPFDQFTIEQIAGDLLPQPTADQMIATAFHRNTLTNNEGGTNDEEFRNVAVVDRVNTTLAVWMGTTIACAQCHTHKFDPITQTEYFQLFAILNNTRDADKRDESPLYSYYSPEQQQQRSQLEQDLLAAQERLKQQTPELEQAFSQWDAAFPRDLQWQALRPSQVTATSGSAVTISEDVVSVAGPADQDTYVLELPVENGKFRAVQIEALTDPALPRQGPGHANGNFVITKVEAQLIPQDGARLSGRYVRVELPGADKYLSLAEVQVFQNDVNIAPGGAATQINTDYAGNAELAIDGSTNGDYSTGKSVTHTAASTDPWWELDLLSEQEIDRIHIWNRTDGGAETRLSNFRVLLLDSDRNLVWSREIGPHPSPDLELNLREGYPVEFAKAAADFSQSGFSPDFVLKNPNPAKKGWAVSGEIGKPHELTLMTELSRPVPPGWKLQLTIEQNSEFKRHTLGKFRVRATDDPGVGVWAETPAEVISVLRLAAMDRGPEQQQLLRDHFLKITPLRQAERQEIETLKTSLANIKPVTVPICEELPADQQRVTKIQLRGNYLDLGDQVQPGFPAAFHPLPEGAPVNRLGLAQWLISPQNPLTPRVIANRYWEQIFGIGIVATSEDFGSQGDPPSHPELLDWLSTELIRLNWDTKAFLRLLVTSSTYRQSSRVTDNAYEEDPDNRLLARGPRFRLSAETIRDQALALSGLLSEKMFGPPVKPVQPTTGLSAAFGGAVDWKTSEGEDKYRRALYTSWRRSNPYPSMMTFDAPNREVCTIRRVRTNTPLQALVTLNDPVYVEAAQGLARRILREVTTDTAKQAAYAFELCLCRQPSQAEVDRVVRLHDETLAVFTAQPEQARQLATVPLGPAPEGMSIPELATWTVIGNVILNLDEVVMKR